MGIHTYIHKYIHTHVHLYIHVCTYTYIHVRTYLQTNTQYFASLFLDNPFDVHIYIRTYIPVVCLFPPGAERYVCMCACMHVCMCVCVYVRMYICMHVCMHARTNMQYFASLLL